MISLPKESWSKTDAKRRWRELEVAFDRGEYDPWSGADYAGSGKTLMDDRGVHRAKRKPRPKKPARRLERAHGLTPRLHHPPHGASSRAVRSGGLLDVRAAGDFIFRADLRHESRATYLRVIGPFIQRLRDTKNAPHRPKRAVAGRVHMVGGEGFEPPSPCL